MSGEHKARLIEALQHGLPLVPRPYAALAARIGIAEVEVIALVQSLQNEGVIKRFGVIVRHHELGYRANAMVVWDVPDDQVAELGARIARLDYVSLCYRRARRLPHWPYNLYCMIHGRDRERVREKLAELINVCGLRGMQHEVLFSRRRFKQKGACYGNTAPALKRVVGA
jgi:DNA-binding Lrp family transcriptional regulator